MPSMIKVTQKVTTWNPPTVLTLPQLGTSPRVAWLIHGGLCATNSFSFLFCSNWIALLTEGISANEKMVIMHPRTSSPRGNGRIINLKRESERKKEPRQQRRRKRKKQSTRFSLGEHEKKEGREREGEKKELGLQSIQRQWGRSRGHWDVYPFDHPIVIFCGATKNWDQTRASWDRRQSKETPGLDLCVSIDWTDWEGWLFAFQVKKETDVRDDRKRRRRKKRL